MARDGAQSLVSVIMANHDGAAFIEPAMASVLGQTLADLELIVVDDGSSDDSVARVAAAARRDSRVRLISRPVSQGPGAARNIGLSSARGRWLAIVDSDDLIHPERLAHLVSEAENSLADMVIDDLLIFDADPGTKARTLFDPPMRKAPCWIDLATYVRSNRLYGRRAALGFCKPLLRRQALLDVAVAYSPDLLIGEDYDLVAKALAKGLRLRATPFLGYFYRKHPASISHRLQRNHLAALRDNAAQFRTDHGRADITAALDSRERSIRAALDFDELIAALKQGDVFKALSCARRNPRAAALLRVPLADRLAGLMSGRRPAVTAPPGRIVLISRQRLVGATSGSSAYVLSLCRALKASGVRLHLISPTAATFGRWPVMRLAPQMDMFERIDIRGGLRLGRFVLAKDPRVAAKAALTVFEQILRRLRLARSGWVKPAPYAVALPPTRADQLFVADHGRGAGAVLCDYAFTAPLAAYALSPGAPRVVVMHDLFSSRSARFEALGASDSVASLTAPAEFALLSQADCIVAIQREEARIAAAHLPGQRVMLAPMAVAPASRPCPSDQPLLLFVGSNTAPNVIAVRWLLEEVWPLLTADRPDLRLWIVGNVARAFSAAPSGVEFKGPVADLSPFYERAAVVVSPLNTGSGLKIKVIEALAHGKAMVVTAVSLQGVERELKGAVLQADSPHDFAACINRLLDDRKLRERLGAVALERVSRHFSPAACYGELVSMLVSTR